MISVEKAIVDLLNAVIIREPMNMSLASAHLTHTPVIEGVEGGTLVLRTLRLRVRYMSISRFQCQIWQAVGTAGVSSKGVPQTGSCHQKVGSSSIASLGERRRNQEAQ